MVFDHVILYSLDYCSVIYKISLSHETEQQQYNNKFIQTVTTNIYSERCVC